MRAFRRIRTVIPAVVLLLGVIACGGESGGSGAAEGSSFNDAEVAFLQMMIPHHRQATEMAEMVPEHTDRLELNDLADTIVQTQSAEIDQMTSLLEDAGAATSEGGGMAGMDMDDGMSEMPGMVDESMMSSLDEAEGQAFDVQFIEMMTEHHEGAIAMAQTVIDEGENPEVEQLANEIIEAQQSEIEQMAAWAEEWAA